MGARQSQTSGAAPSGTTEGEDHRPHADSDRPHEEEHRRQESSVSVPVPFILGPSQSNQADKGGQRDSLCLLEMFPSVGGRLAGAVRRLTSGSVNGGRVSLEMWRLLYSTPVDGRSFPKLVRSIVNAGPTLILIQGRGPNGEKFLLAGCNTCQWKTVAERSGANLGGQGVASPTTSGSGSTMAKQSGQFFGDENCFVAFALLPTSPTSQNGAASEDKGTTVNVHYGNPKFNRNYMYLFDDSPDESKVGMGMGGQPGFLGWFVEPLMHSCFMRSKSCTTFEDFAHTGELLYSQRLLNEETLAFEIDVLEVYSLDPKVGHPEQRRENERKALVKRYAMDNAGVCDENGKQTSILKRSDAGTIKAVLELAAVHEFRGDADEGDGPKC